MAARSSHSDEVISLHNEMVHELGKNIAPIKGLKLSWDRLLCLFRGSPLCPADMESVESMQDLFRLLMENEFIKYGYYKKFLQKLKLVSPLMATLVMEYEKKIQIALDKEVSPRRRSVSKEEEENGRRGPKNPMDDHRGHTKGSRKRSRSPTRTMTGKEKRKLHGKMVNKLSVELSRGMVKEWAIFKNNLKNDLGFGKATLADITDMIDACNAMQTQGKLDYGEYDNLIEVVKDIDVNLVNIINGCLEKMGKEPCSRKKQRYASSTSTRSAESSDLE